MPNEISRIDRHDRPLSRPPRSCKVTEWRPWPGDNPSLAGHVTVSFNDWVVPGIPVFRTKTGTLSVGSPSAPDIDAEGRIKTTEAGKRLYRPVITFATKDAKKRWERSVLTALAAEGITP